MFLQIFTNGEYELPFAFKEPTMIFDLWANVGLATMFFHLKYPNASIYAFEPEKNNFNYLQNCTSSILNIKTFQYAIWDEDTCLRVLDTNVLPCAYQFVPTIDDSQSNVRARSLSSLMWQFSVQKIDILKIDIEGAEKIIFSNTKECVWIKNVHLLIIETHDRFNPGCSKALFDALSGFNYQVYINWENIFILNDDFE